MRLRPDVIVALAIVLVLGFGAVILGSRQAKTTDRDRRASSFVPGPQGARALADALDRLDVTVERFRGRTAMLGELEEDEIPLLMVLDPGMPFDVLEATQLIRFVKEGGHLLLAGPGARAAMRCFGYVLQGDRFVGTPRELSPLGGNVWVDGPRTALWLTASGRDAVVDSSGLSDALVSRCDAPATEAVDTLLMNADGAPVMLQLQVGASSVYLASDAVIFINRSLRDTEAGPYVLALVAGRYPRVVFEEHHHGFGSGGSMTDVVLEWMGRSPWGWAVWQILAVATVALVMAAFRFGPAFPPRGRSRRSPLEHVRALSAALAAARGHDVAVRLMIEGLRRRLSPRGQALRSDVTPWVDRLAENVRTTDSREAVGTLQQLMRGSVRADGVLRAANAVEDVWQDLRP